MKTYVLPEKLLRELAWSYRLRATSTRVEVLRVLSLEHVPMTIAAIQKKTKNNLDSATIFRILEDLTKVGAVHKLNLKQSAAHYELAFGRKHHHHVSCTKCGDVEDVALCDKHVLEESVWKGTKNFKNISSHSLEFFGLCNKCAQ